MSHTSLRNPENHCLFTSGNPQTFVLITGTDAAIASSADRPKLSVSEVSKNRSHALSNFSGFFIFPKK